MNILKLYFFIFIINTRFKHNLNKKSLVKSLQNISMVKNKCTYKCNIKSS